MRLNGEEPKEKTPIQRRTQMVGRDTGVTWTGYVSYGCAFGTALSDNIATPLHC